MAANGLCPPLSGNWTHPDSRLVFSTTNRTVGTVVKVSCDQESSNGVTENVNRMLLCRHNRSWNDTLPSCPILHTEYTSTGTRPIATEVIIIWSIGGALLLLLVSLLAAIICAKRKDSRERLSRQSRHPRPLSTIGLQNPGFVSILDQINHHCMITGEGGCRSPQFVYPAAPPPYPGSLPRTSSTNNSSSTPEDRAAPASATEPATAAAAPESINSLPRPQQPANEVNVDARIAERESAERSSAQEQTSSQQRESSQQPSQEFSRIPRPQLNTMHQTRGARPREPTSSPSSAGARSATMQESRPRVQGRQSRICPQPRRLAPSHIAVPSNDITDPPPPYTPYPEYDAPRYTQRAPVHSRTRAPERIQSIYI